MDDDVLEPAWRVSVADKLADVGDDVFIQVEGEELMKWEGNNSVVALSGSNPLHAGVFISLVLFELHYYLWCFL